MQKLQLAIPEPCHQDWADMTPNQQGRFCSSCAKTVVDFSAMSDAQLILYFENLKNENVCGRVYPDQLDRNIQALPQPKKKLFLYWQYVIAFFMMLGKGPSAKAQGEMKVRTVSQPDTSKKSIRVQEDSPVMLGMIARPVAKEVTAAKKWHIYDENGEAVANASLQFFPSGNTIAADENGVAVPGKNSKADSVTVSAIGYQTKTIALKEITQNIILASEQILLGEVVVPSIPTISCGSIIAGGIGYRVVSQNLFTDTIQNIMSFFDPALTIKQECTRSISMMPPVSYCCNRLIALITEKQPPALIFHPAGATEPILLSCIMRREKRKEGGNLSCSKLTGWQ
jgi:hypothetical protein